MSFLAILSGDNGLVIKAGGSTTRLLSVVANDGAFHQIIVSWDGARVLVAVDTAQPESVAFDAVASAGAAACGIPGACAFLLGARVAPEGAQPTSIFRGAMVQAVLFDARP